MSVTHTTPVTRTIPTSELPFCEPQSGRLTLWALTFLTRLASATNVTIGNVSSAASLGISPFAPPAQPSAQLRGEVALLSSARSLPPGAADFAPGRAPAPRADAFPPAPRAVVPVPTVALPFFAAGVPAGSSRQRLAVVAAASLPAGLTGSVAIARVASTGAVTVTVNRVVAGSAAPIGAVDWVAGATVGTFTLAAGVTLAPGDVLELLWPATADATLADIAITFLALGA